MLFLNSKEFEGILHRLKVWFSFLEKGLLAGSGSLLVIEKVLAVLAKTMDNYEAVSKYNVERVLI